MAHGSPRPQVAAKNSAATLMRLCVALHDLTESANTEIAQWAAEMLKQHVKPPIAKLDLLYHP
jgi:hypothetical protein